MDNLLLINASMRGSASIGLRLASEMVDCIRQRHAQLKVTLRDLAAAPLAPLSAGYATALTRLTPAHDPVFTHSEVLVSELERCEVLLIATPCITSAYRQHSSYGSIMCCESTAPSLPALTARSACWGIGQST